MHFQNPAAEKKKGKSKASHRPPTMSGEGPSGGAALRLEGPVHVLRPVVTAADRAAAAASLVPSSSPFQYWAYMYCRLWCKPAALTLTPTAHAFDLLSRGSATLLVLVTPGSKCADDGGFQGVRCGKGFRVEAQVRPRVLGCPVACGGVEQIPNSQLE